MPPNLIYKLIQYIYIYTYFDNYIIDFAIWLSKVRLLRTPTASALSSLLFGLDHQNMPQQRQIAAIVRKEPNVTILFIFCGRGRLVFARAILAISLYIFIYIYIILYTSSPHWQAMSVAKHAGEGLNYRVKLDPSLTVQLGATARCRADLENHPVGSATRLYWLSLQLKPSASLVAKWPRMAQYGIWPSGCCSGDLQDLRSTQSPSKR